MLMIRNKPVSVMVLYAVTLHFIWAAMLIVDDRASMATAVAAIRYVFPFPFAIPAMFVAAVLAVSAFTVTDKWRAALMMIPQQFMLFISAGGAIEAMATGQFADGVIRPTAFLVADQAPAVLASVGHTLAIYAVARYGWHGPR